MLPRRRTKQPQKPASNPAPQQPTAQRRNNLPKTLWPSTPNEDGPNIRLVDFNGDLRAWNQAWEQELEVTYKDSTPPFVTGGARDAQRFAEHLDELAFEARSVGRHAVHGAAVALLDGVGRVNFSQKYVEKWKQLSRARREEIILEALAKEEVKREGPRPNGIRVLIPELTLSNLADEDGAGLLRLVDALLISPDATAPEFPIVRHPQLDRLYGFPSPEDDRLPLPKAVRAFQEELLLLRHSRLYGVVINILLLSGRGKGYSPFHVGIFEKSAGINFRKTSKPSDRPSLIDKSDIFAVEENCMAQDCHRRSGEDECTLLYCSKCKEVNRVIPYCSCECQVVDYKERHKQNCGKRLSEVDTVPIYSHEDLKPSKLNRHLVRQLEELKVPPYGSGIWALHDDEKSDVEWCNFNLNHNTAEGLARAEEFKNKWQAIRDRAMSQRDELSIGIIASTVLKKIFKSDDTSDWMASERLKFVREPERKSIAFKSQLRREFELSEAKLEAAIQLAEKEMPQWARECGTHTVKMSQLKAMMEATDEIERSAETSSEPPKADLDSLFDLMTADKVMSELRDPSVDDETKRKRLARHMEVAKAIEIMTSGVENPA